MSYEHGGEERCKSAWVEIARRTFVPSKRTSCVVCKRFKSLSHAHHLVPLTIQFDRNFSSPDTRHVWLCPTHHSAVHILITHNLRKDRTTPTRTCVRLVNELSLDELRQVLDIAAEAWK